MNSTTFKPKMTTEKKPKSFMDRAIWVDFPVNTAFLIFCFIKVRGTFQMGIDTALETDFGIATGSDILDTLLIFGIPVLGFITLLSFTVEAIYIILKLQRKQPFITEKYAIVFLIGKIMSVLILIAVALVS